MHQQTIVVSLVGIALVITTLLLPHRGAVVPPAQSALVQPPASCDVLKKGTDPAGQSFEDIQSVTQRFADELGQFKETAQTVSPAELVEQANAETTYPITATAEPAVKLDAEMIYAQAKRGVVVVGGIYKCNKCKHWHVRCASGFVIRHDGLIVTNLHTLEAFKELNAIGVMTDDGRVCPAKAVLAASRLNDLALLKVDANDLRPLPVSNDVSVGATVYCLSHPMMPSGKTNCFYTFSRGMVCGKFTIHDDKQQPLKVLAITNDYGAGSSGGPILNEYGAVVAVACQAIPLFQPEHEKDVQMIWRFGRPSCSILDMLSSSSARQKPIHDKDWPVASRSERETPTLTKGTKTRLSGIGSVTFELHPTDLVSMGYYRPITVKLSERPPISPKAEPKYRSQKRLYGVLQLGNAEGNRMLVAIDEPENGEPKIYIDRKANGDLTASGPGQWDRTNGPMLSASNVVIDVPYETGKVPYKFNFYRFKNCNRDSLFYYRNSGREGEVVLDGKPYRVLALDDNADGRFDDLQNGGLFIDLNQDGVLEKTTDSAEYFRLNEPFNVHGKVWEVASMSANGLDITMRPSKRDAPIKPYLSPGYPAPEFTGDGLDGRPIDLKAEARKSKYVLLDFWASWCGPCRGEFPTLRRAYARYKGIGLTVIGVSLDSELSHAVDAAKQAQLTYPHVFDGLGWKNAVALRYRVQGIPQTYLLDSQLNIVAKNLRGPELERRLQELLGPGDEKAALAVDRTMPLIGGTMK